MKPASAFAVVILLISADLTSAQWKRIKSPKVDLPISTNVIAATGDTLLVGTYRSTIYRSEDGGSIWAKSDSGISYLYWTYGFDITGDTVFSNGEQGIFRSTDAGKSWTSVNKGLHTLVVYSLVRSGKQLFAATDYGVYKSTNEGNNWFSSDGDSTYRTIYSLAELNGILFAGTSVQGIFKSTDGGASWMGSNNGITPFNEYIVARVNQLMVHGSNIYAGTNRSGIYFSSDSGNTWQKDNSGLQADNLGQYLPVYSLAAIGNYLYAGTQGGGIFRQSGPGGTWIQVNNGLPENSYVTSIIAANNKIFAATFNGLYSTSIDNINWEPAFTYFPTEVTASMVRSAGNKLYIYASAYAYNSTISGVYYTTDDGNSWSSDSVLSKQAVLDIKSFGDSLYALGWGLYFSPDKGTHWSEINSGDLNSFIRYNDTLYTASGSDFWQFPRPGKISLSPDNGNTWLDIWNADTAVNGLLKIGNYLFAGTTRGVFLSENTGASWTSVNKGLPSGYAVGSFAAIGTDIFANTANGIYLSKNFGGNWTEINDSLFVDTLKFYSAHLLVYGGVLFAGSKNGVFLTTDLGKSWTPVYSGLNGNALNIYSLTFLDGDLFAATQDGIWMFPFASVNSVEKHNADAPDSYHLSQNYPNPFNPVTKIRYSIPLVQTHSHASVQLEIFDLLGRKIAILVNEEQSPGNYEIAFDGSRLASGVYFYSLSSGNFHQTKKMILLK